MKEQAKTIVTKKQHQERKLLGENIEWRKLRRHISRLEKRLQGMGTSLQRVKTQIDQLAN